MSRTLGTVPEKLTVTNSCLLSPAMPRVCGYVSIYFRGVWVSGRLWLKHSGQDSTAWDEVIAALKPVM